MGSFLYVGNNNAVTGYIEDVTELEAGEYSENAQEKTYFLEDESIPNNKKGYDLKYDGEKFYYEPSKTVESAPYQPSNAEVAQMISDLQVDLIIAGVI